MAKRCPRLGARVSIAPSKSAGYGSITVGRVVDIGNHRDVKVEFPTWTGWYACRDLVKPPKGARGGAFGRSKRRKRR